MSDIILSNLRKHFPESVFQLIYKEAEGEEPAKYIVIRNMPVTNKKTKEVENREIHCIEFSLENNVVIIKLILNCSIDLEFLGRGKDIVDRIIQFSKSFGYSTKIEYDVSKISVHGIEFSLRKLKLLATGQTWYQSLGFYEEEYEENHRCIQEYIHKKPVNMKTILGKKMDTIKEHYSEIMKEIQAYSKKDLLTNEEISKLKSVSLNINNKFRDMEKKCPNTYKNFSDLYYKSKSSNSSDSTPRKKQKTVK